MSPYNPDSQLSKGALSRLEAAGIPALTHDKLRKGLAAAIRVPNARGVPSIRPTTWRSLHEVMRELDLEELSQEIGEYLSCEWMNTIYNNSS